MAAVFINVGLVVLGSVLGLLLRGRLSQRFSQVITSALGLCVLGIGASSMIATKNTLCVILCMVLGTLLGEWLNIEKRMDGMGELLRRKLVRGEGNSRFVEGFVTASVLFCVGAMAINGALQAGLNNDYAILVSKSVIDGVTAITLSAAMGFGVMLSALPILVYEGALTLLAAWAGPYLGAAVITEMSAVGGTIIVGIALNMLGLPKEKIRVGNMLPAIFLPIAYLPLANLLGRLAG